MFRRYVMGPAAFLFSPSSAGMKAVALFMAALLANNSPSFALQATWQWTNTPATGAWSCSFGVAMDSAGNLYTVGSSDGSILGVPAGGSKSYVAKYSSDGTLLWGNQWAGTGDFGITVDSSGNVLIADSGWDKKFSPAGQLLWQTNVNQYGMAIAVDPNGNSYITGGGTSGYPCVTKVDSSGTRLWTTNLTSIFQGSGSAIAVDAAGNVVITGHSNYSSGTQFGLLARLDSAGNLLWDKQYGIQGQYTNTYSVAVDAVGGIYVTSQHISSTGGNGLAKYDSYGNQQWVLGETYDGSVMPIALDPNGAEYLSTLSGVRKYDPSGNLLAQFSIGSPPFRLAYGNNAFGIAGSMSDNSRLNSYVSCYAIPEPSALALLGVGAIGLLTCVWRRRRGIA